MFTSKQIGALKKSNISADTEKTKVRISEDFKAASKEEKKEILELSGLTANAYYNTGKSGAASPKVVLALAQVLSVSPHWYTGEIDEKEPLTEGIIKAFYKKYCEKKANAPKKKSGGRKRRENITQNGGNDSNAEFKPVKKTVRSKAVPKTASDSAKMEKAVRELDLDSAIVLLKALYVRAETGGKAEELCAVVKECLLS